MKLKFLSILIGFISFLLLVPLAFAQTNFRSGDLTTLRSDETINSDYFAAGDTVTVAGTVNGDAYLAGGNVDITGTVNGDVLAAGGNINITGTVMGNIRTAGGNITINGKVGRNTTAAGGSIMVSNTAELSGTAVVAGGNISLLGPIAKGVTIGGGQVTIGNQINGDLNAGVSQLSFGPQAKVNGNVTYWSENAADINPNASVSGKITQNIPPKNEKPVKQAGEAAVAGVITFFKVLSFLTALLVGMLLLKLVPNYVQDTTATITKNPLLSFGIGFLALAITPFLMILLVITLVGIPFAILWLFFLLFDMWLAKIFISLVLGIWLSGYIAKKTSIYLAFLVGLIVYYLISLVPIVGGLVGFITALTGLGAMIITKKNYYQDLRKREII